MDKSQAYLILLAYTRFSYRLGKRHIDKGDGVNKKAKNIEMQREKQIYR